MLDEIKQLREQANELNKQANKIEKEYLKSKTEEFIGKYLLEKGDTYYRVLEFDNYTKDYKCFSLFVADDCTITTEFELVSLTRLSQMLEVSKEHVERAFDKLVDYSKGKLIG